MVATIIVGSLFAAIIIWAIVRSRKDMKSSKCAGCGVSNCQSRKYTKNKGA